MCQRKQTEPKYAVFYAHANRIIRACVEDGSIGGKVGETVRLHLRSLEERQQSCPNPDKHPCCCHYSLGSPCLAEQERDYRITRVEVIEGDGEFGGDDGIDRVLEERDWQEKKRFQSDPDMFDWYYALNILGLVGKPLDYFPLSGAIVVELD
jgi:hypothetical protein